MPGRSAQPKEGRRERNEIRRSKVGPENQRFPQVFSAKWELGWRQRPKDRRAGSWGPSLTSSN